MKFDAYGLLGGVAGLLPVVSWVLVLKVLIINGIHFCWLCSLLGIVLTTGCVLFFSWFVARIHIMLVFNFQFVAGVFMRFGV